ncbi:porin family protein [Mangrovivirga cuniculi]|uniref:Porin n=1 Tax=Mangrovivirga cuniculi TaxID=2715131 RepID=A0A4D7JNT3_9BACT|nr:porin [Mangrovivirga cuniculi]QCK15160.1 hypothetical protein DCC35_10585 [Mangrovivirga cuniculi]
MKSYKKYIPPLIIFLWLIFFSNIGLSAQNAGFDTTQFHPMYVKSDDGNFSLNIGLYTQFRYNFNIRSDVPDSIDNISRGYNLARTRLFFEGNMTDKFYYHFRTNINPSGNFEFFVAFLQYNIKNGMYLRIGRQFMALGREDWIYPQDLAAIEFSANDFTYALWSSFGFQFGHTTSDKFRYWFGIGNGAYGGRRTFPAPKDSDLTLTTRLEYNIVGDNWGIWGDMLGRKGQPFGMMAGLGVGQLLRRDDEARLTDPKSGTQVNLDFSVSGDGFHFFTQGILTSLQFDEGVGNDNTTGGVYSTFGYWLSKKWFSYARFDYISNGDREDINEDYVSPGIGISLYPFTWSNRYRFTLEYNHLTNPVNNTLVQPDGQLGVIESSYGPQSSIRFQAQFGF